MNYQKDQRIADRDKKLNVVKKPVKIPQANPLHRRDDIPSVKNQDKGKNQRKADKKKKIQNIRQAHQVAGFIAHFIYIRSATIHR